MCIRVEQIPCISRLNGLQTLTMDPLYLDFSSSNWKICRLEFLHNETFVEKCFAIFFIHDTLSFAFYFKKDLNDEMMTNDKIKQKKTTFGRSSIGLSRKFEVADSLKSNEPKMYYIVLNGNPTKTLAWIFVCYPFIFAERKEKALLIPKDNFFSSVSERESSQK